MKGSSEGDVVPQELLMTCGRIAGSGSEPSVRVGASIHSPELMSASSVGQQPLAEIQRAPGATPIWLSPPSSPTMVPVTWDPWPSRSTGSSGDTPAASNQL